MATMATGSRYKIPAHVAMLDQLAHDLAAGRRRRVIVAMPPRHGKSEFVSRWMPAWWLGTRPDDRVILCSYEADFAASWGRKVRDILEAHGPETFGIQVSRRSSAANRWDIRGREGGMTTAGVGGPITGRGADLLIIDDPVKNAAEAFSATYRNRSWDWWQLTARTRLEPGGVVVLVMTRWHEDDLAGRLLRDAASGAGEPWDVISLPALAEQDDPLGRELGAPLWPQRYDLAALDDIRAAVGGYAWSALYQQRPQPEAGGLFKRDWFRYHQPAGNGLYRLPGLDRTIALDALRRFATVDLAASTRTTADYTVIASWGATPDGHLLLLDVDRARREGPDIVPAIRRAVERWGLAAVGIERAGFQLSLLQQARREGLPVRELVPDKDKVARALPATAALEGGRIWFPQAAAWLADFEAEMLTFPAGAHDDQVDALAYAVAFNSSHASRRDPPRLDPSNRLPITGTLARPR